METSDLYDRLVRIPLFTGMGMDELQRIVSKTKIDFIKVAPKEVIARQGEKCGQLLILIKGQVECHTATDDDRYAVTETLAAPSILQMEAMFGLFQQFTHTLTATAASNLISIEKKEILRLVSSSIIFRLNLINNLSTTLQKRQYDTWRREPQQLTGRIVNFMRRRCLTPSGPKTFHIKMQTLAEEVNDSRLDVSRALNLLRKQGLIEQYRGRIEIPAMQDLIVSI